MKSLFKALRGGLRGRAAAPGRWGEASAGPTSTFYLCMGLVPEMPLNIAAPAGLRLVSKAGEGGGASAGEAAARPPVQRLGGAGARFPTADVFPALKAFRPSL